MVFKNFNQFHNIFENYAQHLDMLLNMNMHSKQKAFYQWQRDVTHEVEILPTTQVLGITEQEFQRWAKSHCQLKQCYQNASTMMHFNSEIKYVEGMVMMMGQIPIEHAWNSYKGQYFDVTGEYYNHRMEGDSHWAVLELDSEQLWTILNQTKTYGDLIRWWWINKVEKSF